MERKRKGRVRFEDKTAAPTGRLGKRGSAREEIE